MTLIPKLAAEPLSVCPACPGGTPYAALSESCYSALCVLSSSVWANGYVSKGRHICDIGERRV